MPIAVACSCGQKLAVKDEYAGKTVRCPKCKQPLQIPAAAKGAPASASDASAAQRLLEEVGLSHFHEGPRCTECGEPLPDNAVLCVHCGYHSKLKRFIKPEGAPAGPPKKKGPPKPQTEIDKALARAAVELEKEPIEEDQGYGSNWSGVILFVVMTAIALGIIGGGIVFFQNMEARYNARDKARQEKGF